MAVEKLGCRTLSSRLAAIAVLNIFCDFLKAERRKARAIHGNLVRHSSLNWGIHPEFPNVSKILPAPGPCLRQKWAIEDQPRSSHYIRNRHEWIVTGTTASATPVKPNLGRDLHIFSLSDLRLKNGVREWPQCALLGNSGITPQPPMLMDEPSEEDGGADSHSYIVPYGLKGEQSPSGIPITRLCIVVDAVTGEFEEVATFGKPIAYLQREAGSGASHTS